MQSIWGKRFQGRKNESELDSFNASIKEDCFLWEEEIEVALAYAEALFHSGIYTTNEIGQVKAGLKKVKERIEQGEDLSCFEDIHSAVELMLTQEIGEAGKKLATGRSRNELVVTVERLYLMKKTREVIDAIKNVQNVIVELAEKHNGFVIPGYTHLRAAQYILFSNYILSFFWPLERAKQRLSDSLRRCDKLPLGAGALAGSSLPLSLEFLEAKLGFTSLVENSIDALADRSFILEILFILSLLLLDISRITEDLIIFSTEEFGLVSFEAEVLTSSSLLPQKKNPDILELVRASCGRLFGYVSELFMVLKGLPFTYNKDLQADKIPLRRGIEETLQVLNVLALTLRRLQPQGGLKTPGGNSFLLAVDLVDYLRGRGVPFREAHGIVGEIVAYAEANGKALDTLSLEEYHRFSTGVGEDVYLLFDPKKSVENKKTACSTHPEAVKKQLELAKRCLGTE